jgi:hypothetical protein
MIGGIQKERESHKEQNRRLLDRLLVLTTVVAHEVSIHRTHALTFTVTTTADNVNNAAPTAGSLRKAIVDANAILFGDPTMRITR